MALHLADNDPLNKTDPLGLQPSGDDTFTLPICGPGEHEVPTTPSASTHRSIQVCQALRPPECTSAGGRSLSGAISSVVAGGAGASGEYSRIQNWERYVASKDRAIFAVFEPSKLQRGDTAGHLTMVDELIRLQEREGAALQSATAWRGVATVAKRVSWATTGCDLLVVAQSSYHYYRCTGDFVGALERAAIGGSRVGAGASGAYAGLQLGVRACKGGPWVRVTCVGAISVLGGLFGDKLHQEFMGRGLEQWLNPYHGRRPCTYWDTNYLC